MEIKIAPLKVKRKNFVHNPKVEKGTKVDHQVLKIERGDELTRVDFMYRNPYDYSGWIQISGNSFIRVAGSQIKLGLVKAVNIPIAPTKHFFKRKGDYLAYTLYFPALPKGTKKIDIIEREASGGTWFNFYGVSMQTVWNDVVIVNN
jgi:hypothetical protein